MNTTTKIPTLSSLIKSWHFDWKNSSITDTIFEQPKEISSDYKLYYFDKYITSEDAIKEMEKDGYRPANAWELLSWKDWNGNDWVVALGSVAKVFFGRFVLHLFGDGSDRDLGLSDWDGDWGSDYRFLAVRNSEIGASELQKPALVTLDSLTLESALEMVKKSGYEVKRVKNWYITGRGAVYDMSSEKAQARKDFLGSYTTREEAERTRDEIKSKYGNN